MKFHRRVQAWLDKIAEQIDRKADTDAMHDTVATASSRAQECLENAAETLETAVHCASSAMREDLKTSAADLVTSQASLLKRVDNIEIEVAKVPTTAQVWIHTLSQTANDKPIFRFQRTLCSCDPLETDSVCKKTVWFLSSACGRNYIANV